VSLKIAFQKSLFIQKSKSIMKKTLPFLLLILCFTSNAQNIWQKMTVNFRAGVIFANYDESYAYPKIYIPYSTDTYNHWNIELGVEENKYGFGLNARYITKIRGFIKNPIAQAPILLQNIQRGDLSSINQELTGFTFFASKRLFLLGKKHRLDVGLGTQKRKGDAYYFLERGGGGWEFYNVYDIVPIDKYGLFSRIGYTYLISKHFSISTNVEYSRFQKRPTDLFFVDILAGVRF
jgi:hypothetical protein